MKIVSWNIRQGGGRRLSSIAAAVNLWKPDILILQEARKKSADYLDSTLKSLDLNNVYLTNTTSSVDNALFIACRQAMDVGEFMDTQAGRCYILEAEISGLSLLPVHFPHKKEQIPLFDAVLQDSKSLLALPSLLIGDLNCGLPFKDSSNKTFSNARYFQAMLDAGWIDLYRHCHGQEARDFSWISPGTGRGFRYDHALASPSLSRQVTAVSYDHEVRLNGLSDHSALIVEMDVSMNGQ